MEKNELNNKIMKSVRSKIVVSNLEREESMKIKKRKQMISICAVAVVLLSGSFLTVNAATDGKLAQNIKEKYEEIIVLKLKEDNYEVTTEKDKDGNEYVTYTINNTDSGSESEYKINKEILEEENIQAIIEENEEGASITLKDNE